jgi:hypothetical protein
MAVYLQSRAQSTPQPTTPKAPAARISLQVATQGAKVYERQCLQCHGEQGAGVTTASGDSVKARLPSSVLVRPGDQVGLVFRGERLSLFERTTGRALRTSLHDEVAAHG